jgi:hypothetical protein
VQKSRADAYDARLGCVAVMEMRYQPLPALTIVLLTAVNREDAPAEDWVIDPLPVKSKTVTTQSLAPKKNLSETVFLPFGFT